MRRLNNDCSFVLGPEYGTMEASWKGVLEESEKMHDLHNRIRDRLMEEVYNTVKLWQKENFHTKALSGIKETKEMEELFKKAQKPWMKLYMKADKAKKDYHAACKAERTAINQDKNAQSDTSISQDQTKKLAEKVDRCREEKEKTKEVYEKTLQEINACNGKYMEDMTQVRFLFNSIKMKFNSIKKGIKSRTFSIFKLRTSTFRSSKNAKRWN